MTYLQRRVAWAVAAVPCMGFPSPVVLLVAVEVIWGVDLGKGEGDVKKLEALAVRAGEILEKQMPQAVPVAPSAPAEPDAPADDVGAWLKARRLGKFADGLLGMGVECVEDLHDVEPEDCIALGMSHIQQNRLRKELAKLGA